MTTTLSKLPTSTRPFVQDQEYAEILAREIRDYTGEHEAPAREEIAALVRSWEIGTVDQILGRLRTNLKRRMGVHYRVARYDTPVTASDLAKLPQRDVPIIRDPDCAAFVERKLAPLKGRALERGQSAVSAFVASGFLGPFDAWSTEIATRIDAAVRSKEASDG